MTYARFAKHFRPKSAGAWGVIAAIAAGLIIFITMQIITGALPPRPF